MCFSEADGGRVTLTVEGFYETRINQREEKEIEEQISIILGFGFIIISFSLLLPLSGAR